MKRFTIKTRIVLWYTLAIVLLISLFLVILVFSLTETAHNELKNKLTIAVNDYCALVEKNSAGKLPLPPNEAVKDTSDAPLEKGDLPTPSGELSEFKFSEEDINAITDCNILVFSLEGELLYGDPDEYYPSISKLKFTENSLEEVEADDNKFFVYTCALKTKKRVAYWVRGTIDATESTAKAKGYFGYAMTLPVFAMLAVIIGYWITTRAFKPIAVMDSTAKAIGESKDFSRRIEINGAEDELTSLSKTFNSMLSQIEETFIAEKQFTDDASHELRTPIAVIVSQCEYALGSELTPEESKASFNVIYNQAQRMSSLVSQLLTFARIDRGSEYIKSDELDLSELIEIVASELQVVAEKRNITIHCDIEPNLTFYGDQCLLTRLFINLITNAVKFGKDGGNIKLKAVSDEKHIFCSVEDDGIGIPKAHINKIWERFYQVDSARAVRKGGSGLGLSMAKWIVEAHGGTIDAESTVGEGSVFTVTLPRSMLNAKE